MYRFTIMVLQQVQLVAIDSKAHTKVALKCNQQSLKQGTTAQLWLVHNFVQAIFRLEGQTNNQSMKHKRTKSTKLLYRMWTTTIVKSWRPRCKRHSSYSALSQGKTQILQLTFRVTTIWPCMELILRTTTAKKHIYFSSKRKQVLFWETRRLVNQLKLKLLLASLLVTRELTMEELMLLC